MLIQKGSREDAIHALINTWLKDPTQVCGWCWRVYKPEHFPCCESPFVSNNSEITKQFSRELQTIRETRRNKYASNKDKSMRWGLSFPYGLLQFLTKAFKDGYGEDLFNKEYDMIWFAKKFGKYFGVPEEL